MTGTRIIKESLSVISGYDSSTYIEWPFSLEAEFSYISKGNFKVEVEIQRYFDKVEECRKFEEIFNKAKCLEDLQKEGLV